MTATCGQECGPDAVSCQLPEGHGSLDPTMTHGYLRGDTFVYWNYQNERVTFDANDADARERRILDAATAYLVYDNETPETPTLKTETEIDRAIAAWRAKQEGQSRSFRLWKITDGNAEVLSEGRESSDAPKEK